MNASFATSFDLLLLDVHMPELDGFQVVGEIREREQAAGSHLPVIALTARSRHEDRERCLAAGMDEYLAKPIRAAELFAAIDRVVSRPGSSRSRVRRRPADGTSLLDPVVLLAACGDDPDGLRGLCEDFSAYTPARLADVDAPSGTRTRRGSARPPTSSAACSRRSPRSPAMWRRTSKITRPSATSMKPGTWWSGSKAWLRG